MRRAGNRDGKISLVFAVFGGIHNKFYLEFGHKVNKNINTK